MTRVNERVVLDNLGIIAQRSLHWWKFLPPATHSSYDPADMIAEVTLHVVRKAHLYRKNRAKSTTFVYRVADNACKEILARYQTQKRNAYDTVSMEALVRGLPADPNSVYGYDWEEEEAPPIKEVQTEPSYTPVYEPVNEDPHYEPDLAWAFETIEKVIRYASDPLRNFLEALLTGKVRRPPTDPVVAELLEISNLYRADFRAFRIVYRHLCV